MYFILKYFLEFFKNEQIYEIKLFNLVIYFIFVFSVFLRKFLFKVNKVVFFGFLFK